MSELLQFLFSGLTVGATYALAALGFTIIYNASGVINFAQGEFIMLGGMAAVSLTALGLPLPLAVLLAIAVASVVAMLIERFAIEPAGGAGVVPLIIITIGASLVIRGVVQVLFGKGTHALAPFSSDQPIAIGGATLLPQSLWVIGISAVVVVGLAWFFGRTTYGKAMLATAYNKLAAELVGINTRRILLVSFALSGSLGAMGGVLVTPITYTSFDAGILLGLKGFVAATLGGLGSGVGAVVGGLLLGLLEALTAGYISSAYKDAMPFVLILVVLLVMPRGLFGPKTIDRV